MQKNEQKFSPVKQRILQFVEYLNVSKRQFYANTGISRGTLDNSSGINEETLSKLFATYKNINPLWLFTGNESMLLSNPKEEISIVSEPTVKYGHCQQCAEKERLIQEKEERINELKDTINILKKNCTGKQRSA